MCDVTEREAVLLLYGTGRYDFEQLEEENCSDEDKISSSSWFQHAGSPVVVLDSDAEEDSRRYNKLLQLYENMGCSIRYPSS